LRSGHVECGVVCIEALDGGCIVWFGLWIWNTSVVFLRNGMMFMTARAGMLSDILLHRDDREAGFLGLPLLKGGPIQRQLISELGTVLRC